MTTTPTGDTFTAEEALLLREVGYAGDTARAGTSVLVDQRVATASSHDSGVEVLAIRDALATYDWLQDLMFGLIDPDANEHVRQAAELIHNPVGHFVRVHEGADVTLPVQLFSILETPQGRQFTHNVTVIEPGAKVEIVSGAAVPDSVHAGHHISIDECYVREGAVCRSTSIERWGANMESHGYTRTQIEPGASVSTMSIQLASIKHHYAESTTFVAAGAHHEDHTIQLAPEGTTRIADSTVHLSGPGAASETITRMVAAGGTITNRATLVGEAHDTKGFLGCDGLKLSDDGEIDSVPALRATSSQAQLSHEASVGMISQEKLDYLMATGLDEDAARFLIVQGFLALERHDLPASVMHAVEDTIRAAKSGGM